MLPIFIGGCGRSGTTVLATELGRRLDVVVPPEAQFLVRGLAVSHKPLSGDAFVEAIRADWRLRLWMKEADVDSALAAARGAASPSSAMRQLAAAFAAKQGREATAGWVDHTPWNVIYAQTLLDTFPASPLIHVVRDPRAVIASILPLDWGPSTARTGAQWWLSRLGAGIVAESTYPQRVRRVRYEDMVSHPAKTLGALSEWLISTFGVQPSTSDAVSLTALPRYTSKQHSLVGRALDPSRIDGWRTQLTNREISIIEGELGDTLTMMGYRPVAHTPVLRKERTVGETLAELYRPLVNRVRVARRRRRGR